MSQGQVQKTLFICTPIGSEGSPTRSYFDKVRRHIIDPVAIKMGYRTIRADEIPRPGTITNQIVEHLFNDDLVIADMTEMNPNVFYELAVRHAVRKPVILMAAIGDRIPFDLAAQRVIFYDLDPDNIVRAKEELTRQISEVNSDTFIVDSPIESVMSFESSDQVNDEESQLKEIISILRTQSERISRIEESSRITPSDIMLSRTTRTPIVTLSHISARPGTVIEVRGIGFEDGETISLYLDKIDMPPLAYTSALIDGSFIYLLVIPEHSEPGLHEVITHGIRSNTTVITPITIK